MIHDIDLLEWFLGPATTVRGLVRERHGHDRIDDVASAQLEFANGAIATLVTVWHDIMERPSMRHIEVFCDNLYIGVEGDSDGPVRFRFTGEDERVVAKDELLAVLATYDDGPLNPDGAFVRSVSRNEPANPRCSDALRAHDVVDAIYASAANGGEVVRL